MQRVYEILHKFMDYNTCKNNFFTLKAETHDATNRGDKSPRLHCCCCDKTLVLGTQANLEEGKCELVSKFNMADQRIQRRCHKKKLLSVYDAA